MTELHGGTVALESAPGEGSRFRITLPLRAEENQSDSNSGFLTVKRPSSAPFTKSQRILIAEDNDANFQVYVGYLQPLGHQLNRAMNGAEAIELTHSWRPDLVLMDIHMPVMDGLEAMRRLRADPRTVRLPIIAVTALAMAGDRAKCLAAGANAYVTKPVNLNELGRIIVEFSPSPDARLP
jgi:CheY-like chemotaxis protein